MSYFINAEQREKIGGTCFYEFYCGKWDENIMEFWSKTSIYIHDDDLFKLELDEILANVTDSYDPFGETEINQKQWQLIKDKAAAIGGETLVAINEASPWVEKVFRQHDIFTILGI